MSQTIPAIENCFFSLMKAKQTKGLNGAMYMVKHNAKQRKGLNGTMYMVKHNNLCRWFMESDRRIIFIYSFIY